MSDSRQRDGEGPLARARRFLGRVIETVRGSEHPAELVPASELHSSGLTSSGLTSSGLASSEAATSEVVVSAQPRQPGHPPSSVSGSVDDDLELADERVVELPSAALVPAPHDPAAALLADASWSGLRAEDRGDITLLAWRAADADADTLRIVEVRCAFGALDAEPRVTVTDRPASGVIGASSLASDAARIVVSLGSLREGVFASRAHASVR